jgi:ABC-type branched-subunit amino acid transport system permease subunit
MSSSRMRGPTEYRVFAVMIALLVLAPVVAYPVFLMKCLCLALFACAFKLLIGYLGLLSFGHAMFLGGAGYASAHAAKVWALGLAQMIYFFCLQRDVHPRPGRDPGWPGGRRVCRGGARELPGALRWLGHVTQGVVFVLCVLTFRQGIIGKLSTALKLPL